MDMFSIDETDHKILQCLLEDATRSNKEIGLKVHLTGQAVGARIRKLEDWGIIEGRTLKWNPEKLGLTVHAMVTVFLKSQNAHGDLQMFASRDSRILEAHRVSGEGCYWLRVQVGSNEDLNAFLDDLLKYGNYKVSLSIGKIK
ncbi:MULTISPECIES: Lrp/AsnC family transcriptional regulator [unclassified Paenibacillus]|uniref:Lrp/AsnC family transcriptional regulator n=2 Tax=unclassified Paenibacillus TaxID=185978 RepID=UPI001478B5E0|nr:MULTISPECIES: Lrp/AsnC family transcriptional regulator [unclassified Paenibacillus]